MLSMYSEELFTPYKVHVVVRLRDSYPGFFGSCLCLLDIMRIAPFMTEKLDNHIK